MSGPRDCASCVHWMPPKAEGPGECRHRSPRAVEFRPGCWRSQWPPTWALDWCGSHRPIEDDDRVVIEVARATLYEGPEETDR